MVIEKGKKGYRGMILVSQGTLPRYRSCPWRKTKKEAKADLLNEVYDLIKHINQL